MFQTAKDAAARKRKVFYNLCADLTFHFQNGDSLHVNKAMLAFQSDIFVEIFFGSPPVNDVNIDDFDCETFQTFLECLVGLKPYTVIDSLLIFPIAHKYQVEKCLKKCVEVLKPTEMNDNVLLTLNLALFYECNELVENVLHFLEKEVNIYKLLEDENFNELLEPAAMLELIQNVEMDSYVWEKVYGWGEKYLKKHNKDDNVRKFFDENKILDTFSLYNFESVQSIINFYKCVTKKNFLNLEEVLTRLVENEERLSEKSKWVFVKKGDVIEETITFDHPRSFAHFYKAYDLGKDINLNIWRNVVICYTPPEFNSNKTNVKTISCSIKYNYKSCQPNSTDYTKDPYESKSYEFDEGELTRDFYYHIGSIPISRPPCLIEISSVNITYKFFCDCRILKKSLHERVCDDKNNLYFTEDVTIGK